MPNSDSVILDRGERPVGAAFGTAGSILDVAADAPLLVVDLLRDERAVVVDADAVSG